MNVPGQAKWPVAQLETALPTDVIVHSDGDRVGECGPVGVVYMESKERHCVLVTNSPGAVMRPLSGALF